MDLISRQAAISAICNACGKIDCDKMDKCEKLQLPHANCSEFPNNSDTISRQAAIDALIKWYGCEPSDIGAFENIIEKLPSVQPERLTDDDFETIRIHLNAYKEKLCNQQRWEEAEEYQRIIDRFMAFASAQPDLSEYSDKLWRNAYERGKRDAQPEIIRCKNCKHKPSGSGANHDISFPDEVCPCQCEDGWYNWYPKNDFYCGNAERREE